MNLLKKISAILAGGFYFVAAKVLAADPAANVSNSTLPNPLDPGNTGVTIYDILGRVIKAFLGLTGVIALLMFIYGGFLWMTAMGEEKKVTKGRETMVWATLGLVVIFSSYAITSFIIEKFTK